MDTIGTFLTEIFLIIESIESMLPDSEATNNKSLEVMTLESNSSSVLLGMMFK